MKKNYLVVLGILMFLLPLSVAGQELVWSNSFDTSAELQGWTFHDGNGNGNQWVQGQNIIYNGTELTYGTAGVLRHSKGLVPTGFAAGFETEDDWVISPEIDLTNAGGTITFAGYIGRQGTYTSRAGRHIFIYVSTPEKPVPTLTDFQALSSAFTMGAGTTSFPWSSNVEEFTEVTKDISSYAGQKIYIGMWTNSVSSGNASNYQNINIDEMAIYATEISGTPVSGVSLNKTTLSLVAGTNETLTATVAPTDATNKEVTWSSSNEAVATVDAAGKVTAVVAGTADITATTKDGGKTATCSVTVTAAIDYSWLKVAAIAVEGNNAKLVGPDADKFTLFYIDNQPATLTNGQADLTGKTGELSLKATTADGSGVIKLKISK